MSDAKRKSVVEARAAPADDSRAVTPNRTADVVVSLLLLAFAALLAYDNWRTGMGWDSTGPQAGEEHREIEREVAGLRAGRKPTHAGGPVCVGQPRPGSQKQEREHAAGAGV